MNLGDDKISDLDNTNRISIVYYVLYIMYYIEL